MAEIISLYMLLVPGNMMGRADFALNFPVCVFAFTSSAQVLMYWCVTFLVFSGDWMRALPCFATRQQFVRDSFTAMKHVYLLASLQCEL